MPIAGAYTPTSCARRGDGERGVALTSTEVAPPYGIIGTWSFVQILTISTTWPGRSVDWSVGRSVGQSGQSVDQIGRPFRRHSAKKVPGKKTNQQPHEHIEYQVHRVPGTPQYHSRCGRCRCCDTVTTTHRCRRRRRRRRSSSDSRTVFAVFQTLCRLLSRGGSDAPPAAHPSRRIG